MVRGLNSVFGATKQNRKEAIICFAKSEGWVPCSQIIWKPALASSRTCTLWRAQQPLWDVFECGQGAFMVAMMLSLHCSSAPLALQHNRLVSWHKGTFVPWFMFSRSNLKEWTLDMFPSCLLVPLHKCSSVWFSSWPRFARQSYDVHCINFCQIDIHTSSFHLHFGKC